MSSISCAMKLPMEKPSRSKLSRPQRGYKGNRAVSPSPSMVVGVRPDDAATPTLSKAITLRFVASPSISAGSQLSSEPRKCCRSTSGIESSSPDLAVGEGLAGFDGDSLGFGCHVAIHAFRLPVAVKPILLPSRLPGQADDRQLRRGSALGRSRQGMIEVEVGRREASDG